MSTIDNTAATLPLPGGFADLAHMGGFLTPLPASKPKRVPLSPLRYPGGKTRFVPKLVSWLEGTTYKRVLEPFAGGASVSLGLLEAGIAETAWISDADPLIASFWIAATEQPEDLIDFMFSEPVSVERWNFWTASDERELDTLHKAMKTLYRNRTSFSGLIRHGGVLGGQAQAGRTKIDARFNKPALAASIERIGQWAKEGRLEATHDHWGLPAACGKRGDLFYFDPPYVEKSDQLYGPRFDEKDHENLSRDVRRLVEEVSVIVSYDDHPLIRKLYGSIFGARFLTPEWAYGMGSGSGNTTSRELVITNVPTLPS